MVPQSPRHGSRIEDFKSLTPPRQAGLVSTAEFSVAEKCDALLSVCERAVMLQDQFLSDRSAPRTDFKPYQTILREIRSQSSDRSVLPEERTPEAVAIDLATLACAYLSTELSREQSHYWVGVASALTASTKRYMPELNERLINALSKLVVDRTHTPTKTTEFD